MLSTRSSPLGLTFLAPINWLTARIIFVIPAAAAVTDAALGNAVCHAHEVIPVARATSVLKSEAAAMALVSDVLGEEVAGDPLPARTRIWSQVTRSGRSDYC